MKDIWNKDKRGGGRGEVRERHYLPTHKRLLQKEGNKPFFMFIVDTAQNKGLIQQKRLKEEI